MRCLKCPECGSEATKFYKKMFKTNFSCDNCGEALTLEGYSSIFFTLLALIIYQILSAIFHLNIILFLLIICPPAFIAIAYFVPLVHKENRFSAQTWLYAIAAIIICIPFVGMGLYFVFN